MKKILIVICSLFALETSVWAETKEDTVITEWNDGKQWTYRISDKFVVGATCEEIKDHGRFYKLQLFLRNIGDESVTFDPERVYSSVISKKQDTLDLVVYTNEMYQKKIKRSQTLALILYSVSAGLNSASAGYSNSYSTTFAPNGGIYTTNTRTYNANAAYQARVANANQLQSLESSMIEERAAKEQGYLKKTTIHPGESISGYINIKRAKGILLKTDVYIGSHAFCFDWDIRKKETEEDHKKYWE